MTGAAFERQWRAANKAAEGRSLAQWGLVTAVGAAALPTLFKASLSTELVVGIANAVGEAFRRAGGETEDDIGAQGQEVLEALARTPRFGFSVGFMASKEKAIAKRALDALGEWATPAIHKSYLG